MSTQSAASRLNEEVNRLYIFTRITACSPHAGLWWLLVAIITLHRCCFWVHFSAKGFRTIKGRIPSEFFHTCISATQHNHRKLFIKEDWEETKYLDLHKITVKISTPIYKHQWTSARLPDWPGWSSIKYSVLVYTRASWPTVHPDDF